MNQSVQTIKLSGYLSELEGWGRVAGARIAQRIRAHIDSQGQLDLVRISLQNVRKLDVGFAAEALVSVVAGYRGRIPVCLVDLADPDIAENIAAAASQANVPVTAWGRTGVKVLGPVPRLSNRAALAFALEQLELRASELASAQAMSLSNASTRLKELCEQGFLVRHEMAAPSGGTEFVYRRIG